MGRGMASCWPSIEDIYSISTSTGTLWKYGMHLTPPGAPLACHPGCSAWLHIRERHTRQGAWIRAVREETSVPAAARSSQSWRSQTSLTAERVDELLRARGATDLARHEGAPSQSSCRGTEQPGRGSPLSAVSEDLEQRLIEPQRGQSPRAARGSRKHREGVQAVLFQVFASAGAGLELSRGLETEQFGHLRVRSDVSAFQQERCDVQWTGKLASGIAVIVDVTALAASAARQCKRARG